MVSMIFGIADRNGIFKEVLFVFWRKGTVFVLVTGSVKPLNVVLFPDTGQGGRLGEQNAYHMVY